KLSVPQPIFHIYTKPCKALGILHQPISISKDSFTMEQRGISFNAVTADRVKMRFSLLGEILLKEIIQSCSMNSVFRKSMESKQVLQMQYSLTIKFTSSQLPKTLKALMTTAMFWEAL